MATIQDIASTLTSQYDTQITANSIADMAKPIERAKVERLFDRKAKLAQATGSGGGGGGGTSITQLDIKTAIETATNLDTIEAQLTTLGNYIDTIEALISTTNAQLTAINGKQPALGQALSAASVPVAIAASQMATLNPANIINGYAPPTVVTATSDGVGVLGSNANRTHAIIRNRSTVDTVELTFGAAAVAFGQGLPLDPGELYEINKSNLWLGTVNARSGSGISVDISILEGS